MDRCVLPLDVGDHLPRGGVEPGLPLVGAAGDFCLQMGHRARQVLLQVIHRRELLGDFAQVVAFRR